MEGLRPPHPEHLAGEMLSIVQGIESARLEERTVDDAVARLIAGQLHTGQVSPTYSLASSGAIDLESLSSEIRFESERPETTPDMKLMYEALDAYAAEHGDRGMVEGWNDVRYEGEPDPTPLVWVGEVAAYVNGQLRGRWINAAREPEELHGDISDLLDTSPYEGSEGWIILDSANFYDLPISEYMSLDSVSLLARQISEHGEAFAQYVGVVGVDHLDDAVDSFEDAYFGEAADEDEAANEYLDDIGVCDALEIARAQVPEGIGDFMTVDTQAFIDMQPDVHFIRNSEGKVYIFRDTI